MKTLNTQMEETHQSSIRINTNKTAQAARDRSCDLHLDKDVLDMTSKAQSIKLKK